MTLSTNSTGSPGDSERLVRFKVGLDSNAQIACAEHEPLCELDPEALLQVCEGAANALNMSLRDPQNVKAFNAAEEDLERILPRLIDWSFDSSLNSSSQAFEFVVLREDPSNPENYTMDIVHSGESSDVFPDLVAASMMLLFYVEKILPKEIDDGEREPTR